MIFTVWTSLQPAIFSDTPQLGLCLNAEHDIMRSKEGFAASLQIVCCTILLFPFVFANAGGNYFGRRARPGEHIDHHVSVDSIISSYEALSTLLTDGYEELSTNMNKDERQILRRRTMYLPPAPVTPFRGGLKTVHLDQNSKNESLEATSSDSKAVHNKPTSLSTTYSSSDIPAWTPEDYPDPWTNPLACGGAATASHLYNDGHVSDQLDANSKDDVMSWLNNAATAGDDELTAKSQNRRRLLFCDPDQVLDRRTLTDVAIKLQEFSETFAPSSLTEGGSFGFDTKKVTVSEADDAIQSHDEASQESLDEGVASIIIDAAFETRMLRANDKPRQPSTASWTYVRYSALSQDLDIWEGGTIREPIQVAIALVKKIDLPAILRADSYFFYSDQDDMVNDAAQYMARYLHDSWSRHLIQEQQTSEDSANMSRPTNIVLIFISTQDRICYISSGTRVAEILPWWRLEHVVQDMKPDLRLGRTGSALEIALDDLTKLLHVGPPSFADRLSDFFQRFGIVLLFTVFTFVFATWGECHDRRKRIFSAERRSRLNAIEKEKARQLQKEFNTRSCPICLEPFGIDDIINLPDTKKAPQDRDIATKKKQHLKRIDSFGIPLIGTDDKPIKLLRCGHIFDESCWKLFVDSGYGNPWICPVCRQDVGGKKKSTAVRHSDANEGERESRRESSLFTRFVGNRTPPMLLRPVSHFHPNYNSVQSYAQSATRARWTEQISRASAESVPFAPFPRLSPTTYGSTTATAHLEALGEETPLYEQSMTSDNDDDY